MKLKRTTSKLSDSVHQHLNMYALTAGAAGVSLLALTAPAGAKIVYTPANVAINGAFSLDVNNDGIVDFTIKNGGELSSRCIRRPARVSEQPTQGNGAEVSVDNEVFVEALISGAHIGHSQRFYGGGGLMASAFRTFHDICLTSRRGAWNDVKGRYIGLAFEIHGKTHYGWARLTVELKRGALGFYMVTLTGYAYETVPGKSIVAGRTKGPEDDFVPDASLTSPIPETPQPASLGILALGAQGIPLWRRREKVEAAE